MFHVEYNDLLEKLVDNMSVAERLQAERHTYKSFYQFEHVVEKLAIAKKWNGKIAGSATTYTFKDHSRLLIEDDIVDYKITVL